MAKKELTAKREAFHAAADEFARIWTRSKVVKEWLKEFKSAVKKLQGTSSDYHDELREYGDDGDRSNSREYMKALSLYNAGKGPEPSEDIMPAAWLNDVNEKRTILEDEIAMSWAEDIADEMTQAITEANTKVKETMNSVKNVKNVQDPPDIEDDDPDYF